MTPDSTITTWSALIAAILPKQGDPAWYFAFLLIGVVFCVVGWKFIEVKFRSPGKEKKEPPTELFPVRGGKPTTQHCGEHDRRIEAMEGQLQDFYNTMTTRLQESERSIRTTIDAGLKTAREEQDRRISEIKSELKEDMERMEDRVVATVSSTLATFQSGLLTQIQTMFRQSQDGLRLPGSQNSASPTSTPGF